MSSEERDWGFATRAIHSGQAPDPLTGAVVPPIHLATTYAQEEVGRHQGFEYSRSGNPTRKVLETCLAALEGAEFGMAFASGLAASTTLLSIFNPGDHVVMTEDVYGGTYRLVDKVMSRHGLTYSTVDARDEELVEAAITSQTRLIWLESPTNPLLRIADIGEICRLAHRHGVLVCVDNTFATPVLQQPLALGADLVLHSSTKYLGGHSDVVGGALLLNDSVLAERISFLQNALGAVPSPFDCWLLLRGLKTLELRVRHQSQSALTIARHLETHAAVRRVHYPGLPNHPQHALAGMQMSDYGGMVSFEVADQATALEVLKRLRLFILAESLGAVESLAEHPALMTHGSIPVDIREMVGVTGGLIRLSVGIESLDNLVDDLDQALVGLA